MGCLPPEPGRQRTPVRSGVALYHPEWEPALLTEHAHFALHRDAEPLTAHGDGAPIRVWGPPLAALGAGPFQHHMLRHPCPHPRQGNHLPAPAHHPPLKGCLAIGATGRDVFYFMGGLLPAPGKAVGALPAFLLGAGWPVGFDPSGRCPLFQTGFQTGFQTVGWRLCLPFQLSDACFERTVLRAYQCS